MLLLVKELCRAYPHLRVTCSSLTNTGEPACVPFHDTGFVTMHIFEALQTIDHPEASCASLASTGQFYKCGMTFPAMLLAK